MSKPILNSNRVPSNRRIYLQAIFAVAAAIALSTSACSKQEGAPAQPAAKPAPADQPQPQPQSQRTRGGDPGTTNVGRIGDKSTKGQSGPQKNGQKNGQQQSQQEMEPDLGAPVGDKTSPTRAVVQSTKDSVVYYDRTGQTPDQVFAKQGEAALVGVVASDVASDIQSLSGEVLYYTGSAEDTLREQLYNLETARRAQLDPLALEADRVFSQSIQLSSFEVDWSNRRGTLKFSFDRGRGQGEAVLEGPVDEQLRFKVGSLQVKPYIEAEVACMDLSGGCQTVHVRVQDANTGRIRTAHVIARTSSASMWIDGNPIGASANPDYDRLMGVLLNTVNNPRGGNVVERLALITSETIGGASSVAVNLRLRTRDRTGRQGVDILEFTGPLARPADSIFPNVAMNVTPALTVVDGQVVPVEGRMVDVVRYARLLRNDGRGNVQIDIGVRNSSASGREDNIKLTVSRIHKPTGKVRIDMQ